MKKKGYNTLTSLLQALDVQYTKSFTSKIFGEHPHKYNLLGLSQILSEYGVNNAGIKIKDKYNDIINIQCPFVAHVGGSFAVVYNANEDDVEYRVGNLDFKVNRDDFCKLWSGVALLAEPNPNSEEPNYKINSRLEIFQAALKYILLAAILTLMSITLIKSEYKVNSDLILMLLINVTGVFTSTLLLQKQLNTSSIYADKICSLLKQNDCNSILESAEAKLWGVLSWSEIGFSYFISNTFIIIFFPKLIYFYAIINVFTLPYTVWSVWFQSVKAKQWCIMCLIVQILLWCVFLMNLAFNNFNNKNLSLLESLMLSCIYITSLIVTNISVSNISTKKKNRNVVQEINSLKAHEKVATLMLKEQPQYVVDRTTSSIIFGNRNAKILVTVLTNPHCSPCAKMHIRVGKLLESDQKNICIQYVFSSFGEIYNDSNKFLIAAYFSKGEHEAEKIYREWFSIGKYDKEKFFKKYNLDLNNAKVIDEFWKHEAWISETLLQLTPTVVVNGYKLPDNYQIEDLKYILDLEL